MAGAPADDLWRECAAWLTRCKVIPEDHKANWPDSQMQILAKTLRDGVLLCNLMNFLEPNAMDMRHFHRRPQLAQFLCCKNIQAFMDACRQFGLRAEDMFDPMMLFNLTGFHKVLVFLSKLSRSSRTAQLHPNIQGFNVQLTGEPNQPEEDIYKSLHSTTHDVLLAHNQADDDDHDNTNEEEVYQELCSIQRPGRQLTASSSSFEKRDYVIRELLDTETNYLEVLNALRFKFMEPLQSMVAEDKLRVIFPCIGTLADIHKQFLDRLRIATATTPPKAKLSQVILDFRKQFVVYGEYCAKLTNATDALRELTANNPDIDKQIQLCQKNHSAGRSQLRDILSVPMQRILKYHLLLHKLVEETPHNHDDFRGLERAKEAMVDLAQYINEVKRDSEKLVVIEQVSAAIVNLQLPNGNDLKQYGRMLLDGELSIKAHNDQKTKDRYAFVFEKVMILVKVSNKNYLFREAYNLADFRLESVDARRTSTQPARLRYQMLLVRKSQSAAYTLYMKSETDRDKWSLILQEAMESMEPLGSRNNDHKFALTTFEDPIICLHCSKFLKGLLHQGYKCKVCGIAVHRQCIMSTSSCKQTQQSPPPVCDRQLEGFYWFVGQMERDTAQASLINRKVGTYLLRVRPQGAGNAMETMYALSLKTDERTVKHMKINQKREGDQMLFYLSSRRQFKTIVELVSFYERNDLGENFAGLNQSLQWPFKEMFATAQYDFNPTEPNQLPLKQGSQVLVIGKEGDSKGWWRGKTQDRVGFFPKDYVLEHKSLGDVIGSTLFN